jgi:hypothetical protein
MAARATGWLVIAISVAGLVLPGAASASSRYGRSRERGYDEGNTGSYSYFQRSTRRPYSDARENRYGGSRRAGRSHGDGEFGGICPRCGRRHGSERGSPSANREPRYGRTRERYQEYGESRPDSYGPDRYSEREGRGSRRYSREEDYAPVRRESRSGSRGGYGQIGDYESDEGAPRRGGRNRLMREYEGEPRSERGDSYARRGFRSDRARGTRY